jgi:hypothetical protein
MRDGRTSCVVMCLLLSVCAGVGAAIIEVGGGGLNVIRTTIEAGLGSNDIILIADSAVYEENYVNVEIPVAGIKAAACQSPSINFTATSNALGRWFPTNNFQLGDSDVVLDPWRKGETDHPYGQEWNSDGRLKRWRPYRRHRRESHLTLVRRCAHVEPEDAVQWRRHRSP